MNLLVHYNNIMAERAIKILELDAKEWDHCGYNDMLGGKQFKKIVVIMWKSEMTYPAEQWMEEVLPLKLDQGNEVEFL
jgi:hypothetical protein